MNTYVIAAYFLSFTLIIGELIFTFHCHRKSKRILEDIKKSNEEKT
ncbi:CcmD-like small membrane protein [Wolbachia endosymbiont of Pentalonia nigronervosa]|jgi:ABC-type spermidine/putrescine transport system permease subunit II